VTSVLIAYGFAGALREAMRVLGFECGDPRLPSLPLPAERRAPLREELASAGFAELAGM
jgi:dihydrodipicolinate synthase/N-acetylneuraminate lyase